MTYLDKINSNIRWITEQPNEDDAHIIQYTKRLTFHHIGEIHNLVEMIGNLKVLEEPKFREKDNRPVSLSRPENRLIEENLGIPPQKGEKS